MLDGVGVRSIQGGLAIGEACGGAPLVRIRNQMERTRETSNDSPVRTKVTISPTSRQDRRNVDDNCRNSGSDDRCRISSRNTYTSSSPLDFVTRTCR